jgi:hypothetical protein
VLRARKTLSTVLSELVRRCRFCDALYAVDRIADHEAICSSRPKRLTIQSAVERVLQSEPDVARNHALLVRKVWELRDGYRTPEPTPPLVVNGKLSDPWSIIRTAFEINRRKTPPPSNAPKKRTAPRGTLTSKKIA